MTLSPGQYYPYIARTEAPRAMDSSVEKHSLECQIQILTNDLLEIFEFIEPGQGDVYGHRTRNFLITACTEFEKQCSVILRKNGYQLNISSNGQDRGWKTQDYLKIKTPCKLDEYEFELRKYRDMGVYKPFSGWDSSGPTRTLDWYNAYNKVKHNRDGEFDEATLDRCINAYVACDIMHRVQYGVKNEPDVQPKILRSPKRHPTFTQDEQYASTSDGNWTAVNFQF